MAAESRNSVRFFVNGQLREVRSPAPTLTILDWLRDHAAMTGTKEGCAEGDCGACTTVIAELVHGRLVLRPVNACIQFLVTLDGRELITVEGLKGADGSLHPVQQALVDSHASQCGFCTPGFAMSLFGLYKSAVSADRQQVVQALSGNLCRCTGYRPIVDAGLAMFSAQPDTDDWRRRPGPPQGADADLLIARLKSIAPESMLHIDTGGHYWAPRDLDQLLALLAAHPDATLLAGGTDVGLWVTKDFRSLDKLIYLGEVAELGTIEQLPDRLVIGAGVSLTDAFGQLVQAIPDLEEVTRRFASPPICSAGTLVGNVANGSPIGDSMPALLCLDATVTLQRADNTRQLALADFYLGYQQKDLRPGELVTALHIPRPGADAHLRCYKIGKRFEQDISALCGAFLLELEGDRVSRIRLGFGGMAAVPARARRAEQALAGKPWSAESVALAAAALAEDFTPMTDMRASAQYRLNVAAGLLHKFFDDVNGAPARVFEMRPVAS